MILILDIDETLIHSVKSLHPKLYENAIKSGDAFKLFDYVVHKRPYVDEFLFNAMNDPYYSVGIWSAGSYDYVHAIVDHIIPDRDRLEFILTKDDCNELKDKPLSKVRDMYDNYQYNMYGQYSGPTTHDFLIIDDKDGVTGHDELNHLKIFPYEGDEYDGELERLWNYLDKNRYRTSEYLASHWE